MPTEGNYTLSKNKATLIVTKILNQPIENQSETIKKQNVPINLTRNADGSITLDDPADFGRNPIRLTKKADNK